MTSFKSLCLAVLLAGVSQAQIGSPAPSGSGSGGSGGSSFDAGAYVPWSAVDAGQIISATIAAMTLYVDPTGSDSNTCTATGAAACLTLQGAVNKVPKNVLHAVTINMAAGTYTGQTVSPNFVVGPAVGTTITVQGAANATATLASGSATGTTTASTLPDSSGPSTITDTAQTWTPENVTGMFLEFTSGALNGLSFPVVTNTATVLTLAQGGFTLPGTGVTYRIITKPTILVGGILFGGLSGGATNAVTLNDLDISATSGQVLQHVGATSGLSVQRCRLSSTHNASNITISARVTFGGTYAAATTTSASIINISTAGGAAGIASLTSTAWHNKGTGGALLWGGLSSLATIAGVVLRGTPQSSTALLSLHNFRGGWWGPSASASSLSFICDAPGLGTALSVRRDSFMSSADILLPAVSVAGCAVAFDIAAGATLSFLGGSSVTSATTAFQTSTGGVVRFSGSTPTFTGVTNELQLDGVTYPFSFLTSLPAPQVISNSYGSRFIR